MKSKLFIGSSTEGLRAAEAAQRELANDCEPVMWSQGIFRDTNVPIEDLMNAVSQYDFALFVFLPVDYIEVRGVRELSVRDNVLFELGLFLGRLGRQRTFFVAPKEKEFKFHLPSDLSGINPARYASRNDNLQAAIGIALYQLKEAIRTLGSITRETVLYDSRSDFKPYHFAHRNGYIWKDDKPSSKKGEGSLTVLPGSELKVTRTNTDGRNEIDLQLNGPDNPSIPKKHDISYRVLHVRCDARVEGGEHTLRFVAKDIAKKRWVDNQKQKVTETAWTAVDKYLQVPPTSDLLLRIDDQDVTKAPSSVYIRNLRITEESSDSKAGAVPSS